MGNSQFCCAPEEPDELSDEINQQIKKDQSLLNENNIGKAKPVQRIPVQKSGMRDNNKINLNHFELINIIGKGSFGQVLLVRKKKSNKYYAMKILKKVNIDSKNKYKHTLNERQILANANYHFAVSLRYAFQTEYKLYFIMDFINGGELFRRLRKEGPFSEETSKFYIAEILCAMEYLHKKNIIYRDLKPENVLIDSEGHLKLTDFGLAKQLDQEDSNAYTICGTPEYLAPEIIMRRGYGKQVDYWTLGILLYELLTLRTPFRAKDKKEIFENVLSKEVPMKEYFSNEAKQILQGLLTIDPAKRLGAQGGTKEIKEHPFFNSIDWKKLAARKVTPPWKPDVSDMKDLKYFDERLLKLDPYARDSQDSLSCSDDELMKFDGFTLDPSKLRTFALTPNKRSQITQLTKVSQMQNQQREEQYLLEQPNMADIEESRTHNNSPMNGTLMPGSKSAFQTQIKVNGFYQNGADKINLVEPNQQESNNLIKQQQRSN